MLSDEGGISHFFRLLEASPLPLDISRFWGIGFRQIWCRVEKKFLGLVQIGETKSGEKKD